MVQPLWKTAWQFLRLLNIELLYDLATLPLSVYPRGIKTSLHTKTCTQTFTATLFIRGPKWKPPKCLPIEKRINKMWYISTTTYYLAIKIHGGLIQAETQVALENMLSERISHKRPHIVRFHFCECPE